MTHCRRNFLLSAGSIALATLTRPALATPAAMQEAIAKLIGRAPLQRGKVKIEIAPLVENGYSVALAVTVDSPMTAADHVQSIHVLAEKNPLPNVISVHLGPRAGRARFETRIRLADTQTIVAVARMSDGSFWSESVAVVVTLAACTEELG